MKRIFGNPLAILTVLASLAAAQTWARADELNPWPVKKAIAWSGAHPWLVGCNYAPSTAINQLEMWQADSFDVTTIERELGWAESLGFNSLRVFLHDLPWEQDAAGFLTRIEQFLAVADRHKIGVVFVLFDGVWNPFPHSGKQPAPRPGLHNSGWVQSPGAKILADLRKHEGLKDYVQGVIGFFKADRRIHAWDLFNEPDNPNRSSYRQLELSNKADMALMLLEKAFTWAREVDPTQPLTAGVWAGNLAAPEKLSPINRLMLTQSDVISFHNYRPVAELKKDVASLKRYNRPLLCTEYMARPIGSTFDPVLTYLKDENIGAYNWGFVSGKTQTIFPWDSWQKPYASEPPLWFHDIFRADGTPYAATEVGFIRKLTAKAASPR
jgi:Glycosyl hydrolase family 10